MEVHSPPKRMTRARAAAKATDTAVKPTKIVTAAAKAKSTPARATSSKRKTRSDEVEDEDDQQLREPTKPATRTRGRAKKAAEVAPQPESEPDIQESQDVQMDEGPTRSTRATRGRAKKADVATETPKEPTKATRGRPRKVQTQDAEDEDVLAAEPVKKTTRSRATSATVASTAAATVRPNAGTAASSLKSALSRPAASRSTVKRTVTFQEPEKENLVPVTAAKPKTKASESATGMRARPVRKAAASGRTTRASARSATPVEEKKTPLSPKKESPNIPLFRESASQESDDELAAPEKTPMKSFMKSPLKPPSSAQKQQLQHPKVDEPAAAEEIEEPENTGNVVFGSPARRLPSSPYKDSMKSPAKRVDAIPSLLLSASKQSTQQNAPTSFKESLFKSPAKRPQSPVKGLQIPSMDRPDKSRSPMKASLFSSPAKRPASPFKSFGASGGIFNSKPENTMELDYAPGKDVLLGQEARAIIEHPEPAQDEVMSDEQDDLDCVDPVENSIPVENEEAEQALAQSPSTLEFPGRLSAVLPRHADPAFKPSMSPAKTIIEELPPVDEPVAQTGTEIEADAGQVNSEQHVDDAEVDTESEADGEYEDDPMDVDESESVEVEQQRPTNQSNQLPVAFGNLREKDQSDYDNYETDSEDELSPNSKMLARYRDDTTTNFSNVPATPTPGTSKNRKSLAASGVKSSTFSVSKAPKLGFTPLAKQLEGWVAGSPLKLSEHETPIASITEVGGQSTVSQSPLVQASPAKSTYFDDEMKIRADMEAEAALEAALEADIAARYGDTVEEPSFNDIPVTDEDIALAEEANEMSLMEPVHQHDVYEVQVDYEVMSNASQEYGDENAVPIDPALVGSADSGRAYIVPPVTPIRHTTREFHTVSKVPLKPADDSTPRSVKKRSASASRLPVKRPGGLSRNATVISYSPTKNHTSFEAHGDEAEPFESEQIPVTPAKSDVWSTLGTPTRTPRRDVNPALLRGAVVFVDVHTTEGADASGIFIDLLNQMGARCVKQWPWNPNSPNSSESSTSKVGITHVVYKDGGKRTLEKVRESGGVVQCVGVSWVLDCERENEWLEEGPYYIDTSNVPRGGGRRRKSMEPKALANMNGTLVTPMKNNAAAPRDCQTAPANRVGRRDSSLWMFTPSDHDEEEDDHHADTTNGDEDWENSHLVLTPVPRTPAPEAIARYAMDVTPDTPDPLQEEELEQQQQLLMRTCPPKANAYSQMGDGILSPQKDQHVLMRLMAARRKSLQFAPKVASPLSKAWN